MVEVAGIIWFPSLLVVAPLCDRFGLRAGVIFSSACVAAGGLCRYLGKGSYTFLLAGQALNGVAGVVCTNAPPALAAQWFPLHQRVSDAVACQPHV